MSTCDLVSFCFKFDNKEKDQIQTQHKHNSTTDYRKFKLTTHA